MQFVSSCQVSTVLFFFQAALEDITKFQRTDLISESISFPLVKYLVRWSMVKGRLKTNKKHCYSILRRKNLRRNNFIVLVLNYVARTNTIHLQSSQKQRSHLISKEMLGSWSYLYNSDTSEVKPPSVILW